MNLEYIRLRKELYELTNNKNEIIFLLNKNAYNRKAVDKLIHQLKITKLKIKITKQKLEKETLI